MAQFSIIPLEEAQRSVMPPRRATSEQSRQYLRQLEPEVAGRIELGPDDKPITERARLKSAARAEGVNLQIQRSGNTIVFWISEEGPTERAKPAARGKGGAGRGK